MGVEMVSPLVEGRPFPWSWSVVYNSAGKVPSAVRRGPSLWWGREFSVVAMQARPPVLKVDKRRRT